MSETMGQEKEKKHSGIKSELSRFVMFRPKRGELELKAGRNSLLLFWPRLVIVNVAVGLMTKTGFMIRIYNKWSEEKFKSVAILVFGFGFGFCRSYEDI